MNKKIFLIFANVLFLCASLKLNKSKGSISETPPSPVAYYKDQPSWFMIHGLAQYYGTYCEQRSILEGGESQKMPGYKLFYFTCDKCAGFKDKYLSHPIGLVFGMADRPQRVKYIETQGIEAYRCQ